MGSVGKGHSIKILVLGDPRVGKTTAVSTYVERSQRHDYRPTIGSSLFVKKLMVAGQDVRIMIFDTPGQEVYTQVNSNMFENVDGIMLMYDLTRPETFNSLQKWMEKLPPTSRSALCFIVGNKMDLVGTAEIPEYAQDSSFCEHLEDHRIISALTGYNVIETWAKFVNTLLRLELEEEV